MQKHVMTRKGLSLLAKKETELANPNVTRVVAGSGFADWDALEDLAGVLEPVAEMEIGEKQLLDGVTVSLPVQLSNLELTETALIRQIGVYSLDPDEGEILYQIVQYDLPIPLPSYAANNGGVIVFGPELDILFQNSEAASTPLTPGFLVTAKRLQEEIEGLKRELDVALSKKVDGNWTILSEIESLGFVRGEETLNQIIEAMPGNCILHASISADNNQTQYPADHGLLTITKLHARRCRLDYMHINSLNFWGGYYYFEQGGFQGWTRFTSVAEARTD